MNEQTERSRRMARRTFLGWTLGATVAPLASYAIQPSTRIAVVGHGAHGKQLCAALEPLAALEAVEPDAATGTWERHLANPRVDAFVVATEDDFLAPVALAAMRAGKDVYCAAPMAHTADAARAMRDTARECRRMLHVGVAEAYLPAWRATGAALERGLAGTLRWSQLECPENTRGAFAHRPWQADWARSEGPSATLIYRALAPFMLVTGERIPASVSACGDASTGATPDALLATLRYASGHTLVISATPANTSRPHPILRGDRAALEARPEGAVLLNAHGETLCEPAATEIAPLEQSLRAFLSSVRTRREPAWNAEAAYAARVATAMTVQAWRENKTLFS